MELIDTKREEQTKARSELSALILAGLALTSQLKAKLIQWGERMEKNSKHEA